MEKLILIEDMDGDETNEKDEYPSVRRDEEFPIGDVQTTSQDICKNILNEIVDDVFDAVSDVPSIGSIASIGFPVDYEDHAIASVRSSEESIVDNN